MPVSDLVDGGHHCRRLIARIIGRGVGQCLVNCRIELLTDAAEGFETELVSNGLNGLAHCFEGTRELVVLPRTLQIVEDREQRVENIGDGIVTRE